MSDDSHLRCNSEVGLDLTSQNLWQRLNYIGIGGGYIDHIQTDQ